jgi:hypothetical protein
MEIETSAFTHTKIINENKIKSERRITFDQTKCIILNEA